MKRLLTVFFLALCTSAFAISECYVEAPNGKVEFTVDEAGLVRDLFVPPNYNSNQVGSYQFATKKVRKQFYVEYSGEYFPLKGHRDFGHVTSDLKMKTLSGRVVGMVDIATKKVIHLMANGQSRVLGSVAEGPGCSFSDPFNAQKVTAAAFLVYFR